MKSPREGSTISPNEPATFDISAKFITIRRCAALGCTPYERAGMDISECTLSDAVAALRAGKPAIFPTDTVFGLGVSVRHAAGPDALYALKDREARKPIAWLVGGADDIDIYGADVPSYAKKLAQAFWPGSLTLIVNASESVPVPFKSHEGTIGLRMPNNETAREVIRLVGCPLATTSANPAGSPAPYVVSEIDNELAKAVGVVISDNLAKSGVASTIVDCTGDRPHLVRCGAISAADIAAHS